MAAKKSTVQEGKKGRRMTAQRNRSNNETRASIEEQAPEQEPLLLSYAKWIGDSDSLLPMLGTKRQLWVMRCPLRVHPGRVRTFLLDPKGEHWWCTACATHGDVVDLAARLNRFSRREAIHVIELYRQRMTTSAR